MLGQTTELKLLSVQVWLQYLPGVIRGSEESVLRYPSVYLSSSWLEKVSRHRILALICTKVSASSKRRATFIGRFPEVGSHSSDFRSKLFRMLKQHTHSCFLHFSEWEEQRKRYNTCLWWKFLTINPVFAFVRRVWATHDVNSATRVPKCSQTSQDVVPTREGIRVNSRSGKNVSSIIPHAHIGPSVANTSTFYRRDFDASGCPEGITSQLCRSCQLRPSTGPVPKLLVSMNHSQSNMCK